MKIQHPLAFTWVLLLLGSCQQQFEDTKPIRKSITETVFASGQLSAEGTYDLTAKATGYLLKVNFEEGDVVPQGLVLAVIENQEVKTNTAGSRQLLDIAQRNTQPQAPALSQAKASIEIARQQLTQDSLQATRYAKLWQQNSVSRVEYENAQLAYTTAQNSLQSAVESYQQLALEAEQNLINSRVTYEVNAESLREIEIKAVIKGKIYNKYKEVGDYVRAGDIIATIGHPTHIYAEVSIDESSIAKVKVGQQAVVQLNSHPDEVLEAKVSEILPTFDESTQSFTGKLTFQQPLAFQIVGAQLESNIIVDEIADALLIPRKYLDYNGYVELKETGEKVKVKTKTISNEWVHVIEGIDETTILTTAAE